MPNGRRTLAAALYESKAKRRCRPAFGERAHRRHLRVSHVSRRYHVRKRRALRTAYRKRRKTRRIQIAETSRGLRIHLIRRFRHDDVRGVGKKRFLQNGQKRFSLRRFGSDPLRKRFRCGAVRIVQCTHLEYILQLIAYRIYPKTALRKIALMRD